ncbi:MAG: RNA polymerase sigma factor [Flavobacteriales bacterium]|nr:ECF RNA polymerase sigma factor SigL [Flavobacteriales bacterium]MCC6578557.1 RNA polymerase sigma factor [Flavobacteriales bacterium]NUQ16371.1 RNA polymerase sigma factor [Flavobacteriales bacterium]
MGPLFGTDLRSASDERLMERVVRGDERAFAALYDRYHGRVLNYFHRMLWSDRERAQDMLQDLFTKLAQRPELYDAGRPFRTWLFSVANNMCKNEYRREEVRRAAVPELRHNGRAVQEPQAGEGVDRARFRQRLEQELDRLDPDHKATFVMRYEEDLAIKEIALAFGISEGTVKSRLFYTLKKLAERLKEFGPMPLPHHGRA